MRSCVSPLGNIFFTRGALFDATNELGSKAFFVAR